jgi:hypothetical protein
MSIRETEPPAHLSRPHITPIGTIAAIGTRKTVAVSTPVPRSAGRLPIIDLEHEPARGRAKSTAIALDLRSKSANLSVIFKYLSLQI